MKVHRSQSLATQRDLLKAPHWSERGTAYKRRTAACRTHVAYRLPLSFPHRGVETLKWLDGVSVSVGEIRGLTLKEIVRGIFAHVFLLAHCSSSFFYIISISHTTRNYFSSSLYRWIMNHFECADNSGEDYAFNDLLNLKLVFMSFFFLFFF